MSGLNDSNLNEQSQVEVFAHLFDGRGKAWGAGGQELKEWHEKLWNTRRKQGGAKTE